MPQHREVERVDVDRRALERNADVAADERAALRERFHRAVDVERLVGKLAAAATGIREERADTAFDIDPAVARVAPVACGHVVELFLPRREILRQRLEHPRPLVEGHGPERRPADRARVRGHPWKSMPPVLASANFSPVTALNRLRRRARSRSTHSPST